MTFETNEYKISITNTKTIITVLKYLIKVLNSIDI